jgi:hypothetical protein
LSDSNSGSKIRLSEGCDERNKDEKVGWKAALGFKMKDGDWAKLFIRFATDKD